MRPFSTGVPVLIPDYYVVDLSVRMGLYRRLAGLRDQSEIDGFGAELLLVSNENYDGPKRLIIPWKPDFWQTIPDAKKM